MGRILTGVFFLISLVVNSQDTIRIIDAIGSKKLNKCDVIYFSSYRDCVPCYESLIEALNEKGSLTVGGVYSTTKSQKFMTRLRSKKAHVDKFVFVDEQSKQGEQLFQFLDNFGGSTPILLLQVSKGEFLVLSYKQLFIKEEFDRRVLYEHFH